MPYPFILRTFRALLPCLLFAVSCNFDVKLPGPDAFLPQDVLHPDNGFDSSFDLNGDTFIQCQTHAECEALGEALQPCKRHQCDFGKNRCILAPLPDDTACNDGNLCTLEDKCQEGSCQGTPKTCPESDPCTNAECDPTDGNCVYHSIPGCQECAGQGEISDEFTPCCAALNKIFTCETVFDGAPCFGETCIFWCECVLEARCSACGNGFCDGETETVCNCPEDCYPAALPSCKAVGGYCDLLVNDSPPTCADGPSIPFSGCLGQNSCCIPSMDDCLGAGEKFSNQDDHPPCCPPLHALPQNTVGDDGECTLESNIHVCARCGDGTCDTGENRCNCPADCGG